MTVNEDIRDADLDHQVSLRRFGARAERNAIALLRQSERRIVEQLLRHDLTQMGRRRLERLLKGIQGVISGEYGSMTDAVMGDLQDLATNEGEFQANLLRRTIPVRVNVILPSDDMLWAAANSRPFQGKYLRDWFKEVDEDAFRRVRNAVRLGVVEGQTTEQIVRAIRGTSRLGYKDGILDKNRRMVRTTVRTALTHTANAARDRLYEGNKKLIKQVQWVSTLDGRTSAVCRGRDGTKYPVDKGPRPPAHPNCRSATIPVTKSWRELGLKDLPEGTRASMDGQVPASTTYEDWIRKKPVEFQNEVLGTTKARLFRKGGLSLDRFVDRSGAEYTIQELRARDAEAFERAGLGD